MRGAWQDILAVRTPLAAQPPYHLSVSDRSACLYASGRTVHSQGQHGCASPRIALFGDFCHDRPIRQPEPAEWYYTHKLEFTEDWPPREDMFEGWRV